MTQLFSWLKRPSAFASVLTLCALLFSTMAGAEEESAASGPKEGADSHLDGESYKVRLRDLEQKVDALKERIRRSHTRLSLLSDTIFSSAQQGAKAEIEYQNDLSGAWRVVEAVFVLDGAVQYKKTDDTGVLNAQKEIPIFTGEIPAGDHTLQVLLKLKGQGFGVFSYMRGIEAQVKGTHSFSLAEGQQLKLVISAWEQGGPTTKVEDQPHIRFDQEILDHAKRGSKKKSPAEQDTGK